MENVKLFEKNKSIVLMVKTAANACNINCTYCFEKAKDVKKCFITPEKLEKVLQLVQNTCSIVFHGGEPLIVGVEYFSKLLSVVRKYHSKKVVDVRIQTNGTLLTKQWIELIYDQYKDLDIEIAISLDGTKKMNSSRVDYNNNETFEKVKHAFELLKNYGKKAGMLSVISKKSLNSVDEYIDLISSMTNLSFIKINALFNVVDNELTKESILPSEYAEFIYKIACKYVETSLYKKVAIEPILSILQRLNHRISRYCNYSVVKCFNYLSVYPDGSIGPCDCFSINDFCIGNVDREGKSLELCTSNYLNLNHTKNIKQLVENCTDCEIHDFCMCGCLSQRYYFRNNEKLSKNFCLSKKFLYENFKKFSLIRESGKHD